MLWYNKGVYCKGQFSAGDSSLKSQFWTGESKLLKTRIDINLAFLLKVQNVPPSCLSCTMELDMSGHWTCFSEWMGLLEELLSLRNTWEHNQLVCSCSLEGSWMPLAMRLPLMIWNLCEWESMALCWIPPFSIWTWTLFANSPGLLSGIFISMM